MFLFKKKQPHFIQVMTSVPNQDVSQKLTQLLLDHKLAACIQEVGPITSHYLWEGKQERSKEYLLLIKSLSKQYKYIEKVILEHHPYDCPEIIATPLTSGLKNYLHWIETSTTD